LASLSQASLSSFLAKDVFPINTALAFTVLGQNDPFIAINDSSQEFSAATDAIIQLKNYVGPV
jgi:hypothetical protein